MKTLARLGFIICATAVREKTSATQGMLTCDQFSSVPTVAQRLIRIFLGKNTLVKQNVDV